MLHDPSPELSLPVRVILRNGAQLVVREIRPQDKDALHDAFRLLSDESRYTRLMASMKDLPEAMLESATHPVPVQQFVLVAAMDDSEGSALVGGARYAAAPGSDTCEFAVTVIDGWHGLGLAKLLMQTLIHAARVAGYRTMEGFVLASNRGMRGLAHRLGFTDTVCPDDWNLRVVVLDLTGEAGPAPAGRQRGA